MESVRKETQVSNTHTHAHTPVSVVKILFTDTKTKVTSNTSQLTSIDAIHVKSTAKHRPQLTSINAVVSSRRREQRGT